MPGSVYTTRAKLEAAGVPVSAWSPESVNDLIRGCSATLDTMLRGLRFFPLEETVWLDGRDTALVERGNGLPILSVSELTIERERSTRRNRAYAGWGSGLLGSIQQPTPIATLEPPLYDWPSDSYVLRPEPLPLFVRAVRGVFPGGAANVRVKGVFGFADPSSLKTFETSLATSLTAEDGVLSLASVAGTPGLRPRDAVVIGEGPSAIAVLAGEIDTGANTVAIDSLEGVLAGSLPNNTIVRSWGAVPREIELACIHFCNREVARSRVRARGGAHEPSLVRRQWTDGFGWELFAPGGTAGSASASSDMVTGVPEVDRILVEYLKSVWARAT